MLKCAQRIQNDLGVQTVDLLQFHVWDDSWADHPAFVDVVDELRESGIVASIGISVNTWQPANVIKALDTGRIDVVQVIYNLFEQAPEDVLFPYCVEHDIGVIARVPFDEGSLTGTLTANTRFEGDFRAQYFGSKNLPETLDRVAGLTADLPEGLSLPEVALRFVLSHPAVSTVIPGMRSRRHVADNLACSDKGPRSNELLGTLRRHRWDRDPSSPWAN